MEFTLEDLIKDPHSTPEMVAFWQLCEQAKADLVNGTFVPTSFTLDHRWDELDEPTEEQASA